MDEVAGERLDREPGTIAARPGRSRCSAVMASKTCSASRSPAATSSLADGRGILLAVAIGDGGLVLVPVGERRVVLVEHQVEALVEQPEHVAHVTGVLERRPAVGLRTFIARRAAPARPATARRCRGSVRARRRTRPSRRVESALGARSLEHPRPVLGVRLDRHDRERYSSYAAPSRSVRASRRTTVQSRSPSPVAAASARRATATSSIGAGTSPAIAAA